MKPLIIKFILFTVISFAATFAKAQELPLTIIGNNKGTPSSLTLTQLRSVMKGEKLRWTDGTKVTIVLMKTNTPIGINTCKKIYNSSANDLSKLFLALVFQGKGEAPTFFNSVSELQTFISQTPGSIGVIDTPAPVNDAKIILIDGKKAI